MAPRGHTWKYRSTSGDPRRRGERHLVDSLECDLGTVVDLSSVGMRVSCKKRPALQVGQMGVIRIKAPEGTIPVNGRVVWVRRKGLRRFEMGIDFVNVKKGVATVLAQIAEFGFITGTEATSGSESDDGADKEPIKATINLPNYYKILGVEKNASLNDIKKAYRCMSRLYHPDSAKNGEGNLDKLVEIQDAYNMLRDQDSRKRYDKRMAG